MDEEDGVDPEVDEEYRFADRYVAARSWALAAALVDRLPGLRVSQVVDETRTPSLVVHDATHRERIRLDLVGWVLFGASSGRIRYLYWDEVFASPLARVVDQVVAATGAVADDAGSAARRAAYRTVARTLTQGLADDAGWLAQPLRVAGAWSAETTWLLGAFPTGRQVAQDTLDASDASLPGPPHEPLWVLRRGLDPVLLVDTRTGRVHARDGSSRAADDGERRADQVADRADALAFRDLLPEQWHSLATAPDVDPRVDIAPVRYGHVHAEAWRVVAAVVAGGAAVTAAGPQRPGEICRLVDAHGRVRVLLSTCGVLVDDADSETLDWWDVLAAPFPSTVPDRLLAVLPAAAAVDTGAAAAYRVVARVLAAAVDDEAAWRVLDVGGGRWVVARDLEIVVVVDARDGDVVVGRRWLRAHGADRGAA